MPTWDFTADFEEGNVTDFTSVTATPTASTPSVKNGTYGCEITISGNTQETGHFSGGALANDLAITTEFWLDPNGVTPLTQRILLDAVESTGATVSFRVLFQLSAGLYQLLLQVRTDAGAFTSAGSLTTITDDYHQIRVVFHAATGAGNNDGYGYLYIDDVLAGSATGVDNDAQNVDEVRIGTRGGTAGDAGTIYLDDITVADVAEHAVTITGAVSSITGTMTKSVAKVLTGSVSSIVGTISSAVTSLIKLAANIRAMIAPRGAVRSITAPETDVEGDIAPTAAIKEQK